MSTNLRSSGWEQVAMEIENVGERLRRATQALDIESVTYAVAGSNAVAEWVGRVDRAAVRFTQNVDILLRREDLPLAVRALEKVGFVFRHSAGIDFFTDGPDGGFRDGLHVVFAGEKVREEYVAPAASIEESEATDTFRVVTLDALVRMKLTSFQDKDRTHLRDMIEVGLIDATWMSRLIPDLAARLQQLLDDPEGQYSTILVSSRLTLGARARESGTIVVSKP